ncbi:MAG: M20/M25/M40 family metallo-hydrolase, partial [Elusimicrobiaceae bacterium]
FAVLKPDIAFALHNCPGISKGTLLIKCGVICRATAGLIILLKGRTSHASEPEKGNNPALALAEIVRAAQKLPRGVKGAKLTVIGIKLGGRAFGTSPGDGELCLTVRAETDAELKKLIKKCAASARKTATRYKLKVSVSLTDECPETANGEHAAALARQAARTLGMKSMEPRGSFPTGEDFGYFTKKFGGALVWIGAGTQHAPLHSAQYDYPDGLLRRSAAYLRALIDCAIL